MSDAFLMSPSMPAMSTQAGVDLLIGCVPGNLLVHEVSCQLVGQFVSRSCLVCQAGDDQGGSSLVDERGVDFVDDRVLMLLLKLHLGIQFHVVAEVVESELTGGAVDCIAGVGEFLLIRGLHVLRMDRPDGQSHRSIEREDPVSVTLHQVVVDGDDVDLLLLDACQVGGQRGDDRLSFTGLHFRDLALGEHDAADQLDIEGASSEGWLRVRIEFAHRVVDLDRDIDQLPRRSRFGTTGKCAFRRRILHAFHLRPGLIEQSSHRFRKRVAIELLRGIEDVSNSHRTVHRLTSDREDLRDHVVGGSRRLGRGCGTRWSSP